MQEQDKITTSLELTGEKFTTIMDWVGKMSLKMLEDMQLILFKIWPQIMDLKLKKCMQLDLVMVLMLQVGEGLIYI